MSIDTRMTWWRISQRLLLAPALVLLSVQLASAHAQGAADGDQAHRVYGSWRSSRIGGGGYLQHVAFTAQPQVLYTWVDVGGLYRSDDGGQTWRSLLGALPATHGNRQVRGISVDPRDSGRLLVATGTQWSPRREGIYLSRDGGASFTLSTDAALFAGNAEGRNAGEVLMRSPHDPDLILAGTFGDGILRSTDNGRTWTNVGLKDVNFTCLLFDAGGSGRVWACAMPYQGWRLGQSNVTLAGGFYRSDDAGQTWTRLSDESPVEIAQARFDPTQLIGIRGRTRIVQSTDGGANWVDFHQGLPHEESPKSGSTASYTSTASAADAWLIGGGNGEIYRRAPGDDQWTRIPITQRSKPDWSFLRTPEDGGWSHFGRAISSIAIDPRDPQHWIMSDWYALWRTRDAGRNWTQIIDGIENTVIHTLAQDPDDPAIVHLGMADNGYFRSTDGGATFTHITRGGITNNIKAITLSAAAPHRVYALGPAAPGPWIANALFISNDRGGTWTRSPGHGLPDMGPRRVYSVAVDPRDGQRLWLTVSSAVGPGGGGVYESRDGGINWTSISEGLPSRALFREAIWHVGGQIAASPDGSLVCFSHDSGGVFARAADTGAWQQTMDDIVKPVDLSADPHTPGRYLLTDGVALHESRDGGRTWTSITQVTDIFRISFDQAVPGRVALGGKQHILLSSDGGATFTAITDKLPFPVDNVLAFAGDRVVVGTPGCGAYWSPLTSQGAQPVQARPESLQASAPAPAKEGAVNVLPPIREEKPGEPGWAMRWSGEGKPQVSIEPTDANGGKLPTMVVIAQEPSTGSAGAMIPRGHRRVRISGEILVTGEFTQAQVAVQSFGPGGKQIGWTTLIEARSITQWTRFEQVLDLPADYITSSVRVVFKGKGRISLRDAQAMTE